MTEQKYPEGYGTHWTGCWRSRSHWRCAVARVERLEEAVDALIEERDAYDEDVEECRKELAEYKALADEHPSGDDCIRCGERPATNKGYPWCTNCFFDYVLQSQADEYNMLRKYYEDDQQELVDCCEKLAAAEAREQRYGSFATEARHVMRKHGFVLDDLEDRWQKLVLTLYNMLVRIARDAEESGRAALDAVRERRTVIAFEILTEFIGLLWNNGLDSAIEETEKHLSEWETDEFRKFVATLIAALEQRTRQTLDSVNRRITSGEWPEGEVSAKILEARERLLRAYQARLEHARQEGRDKEAEVRATCADCWKEVSDHSPSGALCSCDIGLCQEHYEQRIEQARAEVLNEVVAGYEDHMGKTPEVSADTDPFDLGGAMYDAALDLGAAEERERWLDAAKRAGHLNELLAIRKAGEEGGDVLE